MQLNYHNSDRKPERATFDDEESLLAAVSTAIQDPEVKRIIIKRLTHSQKRQQKRAAYTLVTEKEEK